MDVSPASRPADLDHQRHRHELQREFAVMILYVSIVLLATLAALPAHDNEVQIAGVDISVVVIIVWGTAIGLSLAHWFAFVVAAAGFRGGRLHRHDMELAMAHVAGAALVALCTTIPIALTDDISDVRAAAFAPATFIGLAGYRVARSAGRSTGASLVAGGIGLLLGLAVAGIKAFLSH
jgi:hypothetical protein